MSHFIGLCFGENWENDLERYDENNRVDRYIVYTKKEAIEKAIENHKENYDNASKALDKSDLTSTQIEYFTKIMNRGPFLTEKEAWDKALSWGYDMDDEGNFYSTYNPDSRWDWYSIGGRWDGFLVLKEKTDDGEIIEVNEAYFDEIDWDYMREYKFSPFCFIDEDGDWHEKGEMGWFGVCFNEKPAENWDKYFQDYLDELKLSDSPCLVTVVDFHI